MFFERHREPEQHPSPSLQSKLVSWERPGAEAAPAAAGPIGGCAVSIDTLSPRTLRIELEGLDADITAIQDRVASLEREEQEAFERHDKPALDTAWPAAKRRLRDEPLAKSPRSER